MGVNNNTELQSMLNQALSQMNSLGISSSSLGGSSGSGNNYINSLWTIAGQVQGAIEGNDEQKAQASINILQGLLNMISFSKNHQTEAQKEVNKNSQAINKNENDADQKAQQVKAKIDEVVANIESNQTNIQNALKELEGLEEYTGKISELKEQINEQLDIIEENKEKINDPEQREEALAAINGAAKTINALVEQLGQNILYMQESIEGQQAVVEENVNQITTTITDSTQEISQGVADLQTYIQKDAQEGAVSTQIATKAAVDTTTGTTEVATGEAINSNIFSSLASGGQGVKLVMDGQNRIGAGQTRLQGGVSNLQKVMSGIGKIGQDISELSQLTDGIGKIGDGVITLVGQFDKNITPYIESIGSLNIEAICDANDALQTQVKAWNTNISTQENEDINNPNKEQSADPVGEMRAVIGNKKSKNQGFGI